MKKVTTKDAVLLLVKLAIIFVTIVLIFKFI